MLITEDWTKFLNLEAYFRGGTQDTPTPKQVFLIKDSSFFVVLLKFRNHSTYKM